MTEAQYDIVEKFHALYSGGLAQSLREIAGGTQMTVQADQF